ncbi:hypothetical protein GAYE_SCF68G6916 [Galdieria yellowstonensis]|uniref:Cell division control protein n=1 Tax=Galdieria yellowstonensis TaxID=3028027 RepID=A0AAV9INF5_9RHOD|nr:hypothetical protein GAYE_SCF68G6916 [Galdieria yellowstonensis]
MAVVTRSGKRCYEKHADVHSTNRQQQQLTSYARQKRPRSAISSSCFTNIASYFSLSYEPSNQVVGREHFIATIADKLNQWLRGEDKMSCYLCGRPGTGKSLCVKASLDRIDTPENVLPIYINCASISDPKRIYSVIVAQLEEKASSLSCCFSSILQATGHSKEKKPAVDSNGASHVLVVLEELDFLVTRDASVLRGLLEIPYVSQNVGILATANSVDLVERTMSCLKIQQYPPETIAFGPYVGEEMEEILCQRFQLATKENMSGIPVSCVMTAFQLVAKKVSSSCGDVRLALDVVRTLFLSAAKTLSSSTGLDESVWVQLAAKIMEERGGVASMKHRIRNLPFQQQLVVLACFVLSNKRNGRQSYSSSLFTLHELYTQLTDLSGQLELKSISFSQMVDICETSLTDHGIIQLDRKIIDKRRQRWSLIPCASEIKAALEPFTVYASWLSIN